MAYKKLIIIVTVMSLCMSDVKLEDASPKPRPFELDGVWYVGGLLEVSSKFNITLMPCWRIEFSTTDEFYDGVSGYFNPIENKTTYERLNATELDFDDKSINLNISMMFGDKYKNFVARVEQVRKSMLITPKVKDATRPFTYLMLGREPKSLAANADIYGSDLIINNTNCEEVEWVTSFIKREKKVKKVQGGDASSIHINSSLIVLFILFIFQNVNLTMLQISHR